MKTRCATLMVVALTLCPVHAATRYVNLNNPTPSPPYTSWATAATTIQDAINVSTNNDYINVTNGVYTIGGAATPGSALMNRVMANKRVYILSVNGPEQTVIYGQGPAGPGAARCVYLSNDAVLVGFTLSNGFTRTTGDTTYDQSGGGAFIAGSGFITNCIIRQCFAQENGGGAFIHKNGFIGNTVFVRNVSSNHGGGAYCFQGGMLAKCIFAGNRAQDWGGGAYAASAGVFDRCDFYGNRAQDGGALYCNSGGQVNNALIIWNTAAQDGGGAFLNGPGVLQNCSVGLNYAARYGGGVVCRLGGTNLNALIYHNTAGNNGPNYHVMTTGYFAYCCSYPAPIGAGNITNDPRCTDLAAGDLHLTASSPCVNSGNNGYAPGAVDNEGRQRILGTPLQLVDIGCYEYVPQDTAPPTNRYVSTGGGNVWPYATEATAARNVQDALDAAGASDTIILIDEVHSTAFRSRNGHRSRMLVTKPVTIEPMKRQLRGAVIAGAPDVLTGGVGSNAVRCAFIAADALVKWLVFSNGFSRGDESGPYEIHQETAGGILFDTAGTVSNCLVSRCAALAGAGMAFFLGGAAYDCGMQWNAAADVGGGALFFTGGIMRRSMVVRNEAMSGGGVYMVFNPTKRAANGVKNGVDSDMLAECNDRQQQRLAERRRHLLRQRHHRPQLRDHAQRRHRLGRRRVHGRRRHRAQLPHHAEQRARRWRRLHQHQGRGRKLHHHHQPRRDERRRRVRQPWRLEHQLHHLP